MTGRAPEEEGRTATTLELFFDLVFVVAVASAAGAMHHHLIEGLVAESIISYAQVFFAIWWAWMNFTWFASAYDTDDVPYRVMIFIAIVGALVLAAGVPAAFDAGDYVVVTIGYVIMRLALVSLWVRASRDDPDHRRTAIRFALGVSFAQVGWVLLLFLPDNLTAAGFMVLVIAELAVPIWAESAAPAAWHPEHIEERYGLFTIIVLGESILASSLALQSVMSEGDFTGDLIGVVIGGLLIVFSMWWLYFARPHSDLLTSLRRAFTWGYGHYFVWGSAAAVGAGLAVSIDHSTGHSHIGDFGAGAAVAVPVAIYLSTLWALTYMPGGGRALSFWTLLAAALVLVTPLMGQGILITGLILAALVVRKVVATHDLEQS